MSRKTFQRLSQDDRRKELMEAVLACVAEHGFSGATVRRVTEQAGVTPGLVRYYFGAKDEMIKDAYAYLVGQLTESASQRARDNAGDPVGQLRQFLVSNVIAPNLSEAKVSLWATFIGQVRADSEFAAIHREGYREFLNLLELLIEPVLAAHGLPHGGAACKRHAIALNGLIDGLWVEGSLNSGLYSRNMLPELLTEAAEHLLGLPKNALARVPATVEE